MNLISSFFIRARNCMHYNVNYSASAKLMQIVPVEKKRIKNEVALYQRQTVQLSDAVASPQAGDEPIPNTPAPRIVRAEPGKVRLGFVPEEWFTCFYNKTGVTGHYTFWFTFGTYLLSKEIYVLEHNYYEALAMGPLCVATVKKLGPPMAKALDAEIDEYEATWNKERVDSRTMLEDSIKDEEKNQWSSEGQLLLVEAKRENVALQLEAVYRERLFMAYSRVKSLLDYQVASENAIAKLVHKQYVDWVVNEVRKHITPEFDKLYVDTCIETLARTAKTSG